MATPGQELTSLDFESLIGGPLIAVVHAQAQAALATVNFIKEVGFKKVDQSSSSEEPATVEFKYKKIVPGDANPATMSLTIPLLSMLPIPYLRIEETNIDFLAKINSVETREIGSSLNLSGELDVRAEFKRVSARLKVTAAYQRQTKEGSTVTRDYSMSVKIKAVQEDMPGGLSKLIEIMESLIEAHKVQASS